MRLHSQIPDSRHFWVRHMWRPWPGPQGLWVDLSRLALGGTSGPDRIDPSDPNESLSDVLYLPPVEPENEEVRAQLGESLTERGTPVIYQVLAGNGPGPNSTISVLDPLSALLRGESDLLAAAPPGGGVIWPLLAGYTDDRGIWERVLAGFADSGVGFVQGIALELSPGEKRRIVEVGGTDGFEALFHGAPVSERAFASAVERSGLSPYLERPLPQGPPALVGNRELAGVLCSIGELWQSLGRIESRGQELLAAARRIDRDKHDISALAREGNLDVVDWLGEQSRSIIRETVRDGRSSLLEELRREFVHDTQGR